jgi:arylsulfatase A-like enzyme
MQHPNILLISIDTLRADHLSCYGYRRPTTPAIDAIAAEGALFKNAYSAAVWTPPAHASMLTGLYPSHHGAVDYRKLNPSIPTIAGTLRDRGFRTVGFVNNPAVGEFVGLEKGHDEFFEIWKGVTSNNAITRGAHWLHRTGLEILGIQDHGAKSTNRLVKKWLCDHGSEQRPFFMFVHYIEPHNPIDAPHPFKKRFVELNGGEQLDMNKIARVAHNPLVCYTDQIELNSAEVQYLIALYDGEINYVDSMVGDLIDSLRAMKILDDTMIIITADHGEHFGEHGHYSHASSLYQPLVHIPLAIRYPRPCPQAAVFTNPVQHIDIFPTILDLLGDESELMSCLPGKSLLPKNGQLEIAPDRPIVAEWEGRIPHFVKHRLRGSNGHANVERLFTTKKQMILVGDRKYICSGDGDEELYNLQSDPGELHNLASEAREQCWALKEALGKILNAEIPVVESVAGVMDDVVEKRLRALGYL